MKNLSLILNVILVIAVAVLFYLHFTDRNEVVVAEGALADGSVPAGKTVVAYINSDSLLNNYLFFKDKEVEFKALEEKYTKEYENRARGLQSEIQIFQQTAGNMTMGQAKAREEELMRKQNNLVQYQQNLAQRLMQEQASFNDSLYNVVRQYAKEYGEENNVDIVLTYTKGSGVLYASDSLDITQEIIAGLNERYRTTKGTTETAEKQ